MRRFLEGVELMKALWTQPEVNYHGTIYKLDLSHAYSDSLSDYPMLAVVGRPCAVNPSPRLRAHARAYEWPILDLRSTQTR